MAEGPEPVLDPPAPEPGASRSTLRLVGLPFLASRLALWVALVIAFLTLPAALLVAPAEDDPALTHDLGWLTDVWARWDSVHFLEIAEHGYGEPLEQASTAFYPLYPALVGLVGRVLLGHYVLAGVLVSLAAAGAAACLLFELARRRVGDSAALRAVVFLGVFPYALFLQAVYSESLFLALALAAFVACERGRMPAAGILAGLAMLTRPTGVAVLVGVAILAWQARHELRDLAWLLVAPALFLLYPLVLWQQRGAPFAFTEAEEVWGRSISPAGPLGGLWDGTRAAWFGLRQLVSGTPEHPFWTSVDPDRVALMNLENLAYVVVFTVLAVVAWRRLGAGYGVYALACVALALSAPSTTYPTPILSFPRFALVIFPAFIALGAVVRRPQLVLGVACASALLLGVNLLRWAAWQFIA